jgi:hypothetical protein
MFVSSHQRNPGPDQDNDDFDQASPGEQDSSKEPDRIEVSNPCRKDDADAKQGNAPRYSMKMTHGGSAPVIADEFRSHPVFHY